MQETLDSNNRFLTLTERKVNCQFSFDFGNIYLFSIFLKIFSHWFVRWKSMGLPHIIYIYCVKIVRFRSYSGPYFPAFGLNTERYGVSPCIQSECGKIWTRNYSVFWTLFTQCLTLLLLLRAMFHTYRNPSADLHYKLIEWFLYE